MRLLFLAAMVCVVAGGCTRETEEDATPLVAKVAAHIKSAPGNVHAGELSLPGGFALPSVDHVKQATTWQDRLSTLTHSERQRMESLNQRYYGMLEFNSEEEQRKLVALGFPMPEEWLAADAMSDAELARLAKANSPKGAIFYANRQLDKFIASKQRLTEEGRYGDLDPSVFDPKVEALVYAGKALALTRSPFAAYLYGSVHAAMFNDRESTAAAISVARSLGDPRSSSLAQALSQRQRSGEVPPLDFVALSAIEAGMWSQVHRYRPL